MSQFITADEFMNESPETTASPAFSGNRFINADDFEREYVTQQVPKLSEVANAGTRFMVGLTEYTDQLQRLPAQLTVYMGNAIRQGSLRAKYEKSLQDKPAGLYNKPDDMKYNIGNRILNLGMQNLKLIQDRQQKEAVVRDEKFDWARDIGQGAPSIIQSVLVGATMGPLAAGGAVGLQMLGSKTEQILDKPEDIKKPFLGFGDRGADKLVSQPLFNALVESGLEVSTLTKFLKETGPFIQRTIKQTITEGIQEAAQTAGEAAVDIAYQTRPLKEAPDALVESVYSFALGGILGGPTAMGFNIANRNATIDYISEITGDRKTATKIADKVLEGSLDDVTTILETNSGMKEAHIEVYNAMYNAIYKHLESTGAMKDMSEDDRSSVVKQSAKSFADQAALEAFYRGVPVSEIVDGANISVNDEGNIVIVGGGKDQNKTGLTQEEQQRLDDLNRKEEGYESGNIKSASGFLTKEEIEERNNLTEKLSNTLSQSSASIKSAVDKFSDSLVKAAKKAESFEEFVKGQGKPLYHGSDNDIKELDAGRQIAGDKLTLANPNEVFGEKGVGRGFIFLSNSKKTAEYFGKAHKIFPIRSLKLLDPRTKQGGIELEKILTKAKVPNPSSYIEEFGVDFLIIDAVESPGTSKIIREELENEGFDGVITHETDDNGYGIGSGIAILNDKVNLLNTESQLRTIYDKTKGKVSEEDPSQELFQGDKENGKRASISISKNEYVIKLLQTADESSLPHELSHFWLDNMWQFVKSGNASSAYIKRWMNIADYLGISEGQSSITEEQQEKFARSFEAYLMKGVAPSANLVNEFDAYKKWLEGVYKDAKNLNVSITPQAERFFDSMFAVDKGYAENREKFGTHKRPSKTGRDVSEFVDKLFVPLSTRLDKISPKLKHALRKFIYTTNINTKKDIDAVRPFIEKISEISEDDYKDLDLALKNRDLVKVDEIVKRNGLEVEFTRMQQVLEDIFTRAKDAGLDVGYIEDYFPRRVQDVEEYLDFLRGKDNWTNISRKIRDEERASGRPLSEEEKAHVADMALRGYGDNKINAGRAGNTKARGITKLTADQNMYYKPSQIALIEYITSMNDKIEAAKFIGSGKNFDDSIGSYVAQLIEGGIIYAKQEREAQRVLRSYFKKRGTSGLVSGYKNFSYIYTMGSPISAITQISDLAFAFYKNGFFNTFKSIVSNDRLTKQDLGIDNIIEEFSDQSKSGKAVNTVFKLVGLEWMDAMGKSVYIDGAFKRLSKLAKEDKLDLVRIFNDEAEQVKKDLIAMNPTDNVKYLLFSELADVQPIALSEMPESYVSGGNARLWYMLKSYTIKQLDVYHNEVGRQFGKDPAKAFGNLLRLTLALMLMGATSDVIKDVLLGRPIKISDLVLDNILKSVGFSKYTIYKLKREGALTAMFQMTNPPVPFFDDLIKDISSQFKDEPTEVKDLKIWNALPIVGKFYYWWFGGGRRYIEENE